MFCWGGFFGGYSGQNCLAKFLGVARCDSQRSGKDTSLVPAAWMIDIQAIIA